MESQKEKHLKTKEKNKQTLASFWKKKPNMKKTQTNNKKKP